MIETMDEKRVKYFNNNDLSVGMYLGRFKEIINSLDTAKQPGEYSLNDILELSNVLKFIENELFDRRWSKANIQSIESKKASTYKIIATYFNTVSAEALTGLVKDLNREYNDDFIEHIERFKLANKISEEDLSALISAAKIPLWSLLKSKYLVNAYPSTFKDLFLANSRNFEILLGNFTESRRTRVNIPKTTPEEMLELCRKYIESEDANINYLRILSLPIDGMKEYFQLDAQTRLLAKRRASDLEDELFQDQPGVGVDIRMAVYSSEDAYEKQLESATPVDQLAYVDDAWIERHLDFPTLLNNVQYLYGLFTHDLVSSLPSFPKLEMGALEPHLGVKTSNSYPVSQAFSIKQHMAHLKMRVLADILGKHDISIEQLIDWFFSTYSKDVFNVDWLHLSMPSPEETYANKTATLLRIEESIRTQYYVYATTNTIDRELVDLTNTPGIRELPSQVEKKYAYLSDNEDVQNVVHLLFSDQSSIAYINDQLNGDTFIELIVHNSVKLKDFHEYQVPRVKYLIKQNTVIVAKDKTLHISDAYKIGILQKLYARGVVAYHHQNDEEQVVIDRFVSDDWLITDKTLFSTQEVDYLNYVLNNSRFDNSMGLRNSYQHGIPNYEYPAMYERDYYITLALLLTYVVKINDELNLARIAVGDEGSFCNVDFEE